MMGVIVRFGPYIFFSLAAFFVIGGFVVAMIDPPQLIMSRFEQNRLEHRRQIIFVMFMAAAALCGLTFLGCLMVWWESH